MSPATAEHTLAWILRVLGALTLLAVVGMVMPTDWMERANDALGLGPFHRSPLMEYLTRSLSAVYALFGAVALYVSFDLGRYLPLVAFFSPLLVVYGAYLTWLDFWAEMPAHWSWTEGPPTVIVGLVMTWLARRAAASA